MSSLRNDARLSFPPVGSVSDGVDNGRSLRSLTSKRWESNGQCGERGALCTWDDGKDGDPGVNDVFHDALGKTKERGRPGLGKAVRLLMAGRKRWGQKLCSTILRAIMRRVTSAPQQTDRYLGPLQLAHNSLMRSDELEGEMRNLEEK